MKRSYRYIDNQGKLQLNINIQRVLVDVQHPGIPFRHPTSNFPDLSGRGCDDGVRNSTHRRHQRAAAALGRLILAEADATPQAHWFDQHTITHASYKGHPMIKTLHRS